MSCIPLPPLPFPELPDGINLGVTIPLPELSTPGICCLQPIPLLSEPSLPLGFGAINPAFIQTVKAGLAVARAWYSNLPPKCPRQ